MRTIKLNSKNRPDESLLKLIKIHIASSSLIGFLNRKLDRYGLTINKLNTLQILSANDSLSMNALKQQVADKGCDLSRLVISLQKQGLVEIQTNLTDRRGRMVSLSNKGQEMLDKLFNAGLFHIDREANKVNDMIHSIEMAITEQEQDAMMHYTTAL